VNVDLPWNPAKLEQRIARAWRKHQTRSVSVVNLVCEQSIEAGILGLLGTKQALADGVLDGLGDLEKPAMPSGRGALIERMKAAMQAAEAAPRIVPADEAIAADLASRYGERALLVEARERGDGAVQLLAVLDLEKDALAVEAARLAAAMAEGALPVEVIDRATWACVERLQAIGLLQRTETPTRVLHRAA